MNTLYETIKSGVRRRFVAISKVDLIEWINDNHKANDICKQAKAHLDQGTKGISEIPESVVYTLLRQFVKKIRAETVESKKLKESGSAGSPVDLDATGKNQKKDEKNSRDAPKSASKRVKGTARVNYLSTRILTIGLLIVSASLISL
jgi:hypothetical protein